MVKTLYGGSCDGVSSTYAIWTPVFASSSSFNFLYNVTILYQMYKIAPENIKQIYWNILIM